MNRIARPTLAVFAGLGIVGVLAACSPAEAEETTGSGSTGSSTPADSSESGTDDSTTDSGSGESGDYADGTYEAEGSYQSPAGQEEIGVSITLEGDIVTAVTVTPTATSGNSAQYQNAFAGGIADVVVGQDIDSLSVSKVSGSSLTSGGFNEALEQIKSDAAA
jgi:uncharacterized protein with FMN-binding domain